MQRASDLLEHLNLLIHSALDLFWFVVVDNASTPIRSLLLRRFALTIKPDSNWATCQLAGLTWTCRSACGASRRSDYTNRLYAALNELLKRP